MSKIYVIDIKNKCKILMNYSDLMDSKQQL